MENGLWSVTICFLWILDFEFPRIFRQSAHDGGKVTNWLPLPPRDSQNTRGIVRLEEICKKKKSQWFNQETNPRPSVLQRSTFTAPLEQTFIIFWYWFNPLRHNDPYRGRTTPLTSKCCILYIYSTNIGTEYFKHGIYCPLFPLQNAVCFIILTYLVRVLFTFYIQSVLKLKKNNSGVKKLIKNVSVSDIKEILRPSILLEQKLNEIGVSYKEFHKRFWHVWLQCMASHWGLFTEQEDFWSFERVK